MAPDPPLSSTTEAFYHAIFEEVALSLLHLLDFRVLRDLNEVTIRLTFCRHERGSDNDEEKLVILHMRRKRNLESQLGKEAIKKGIDIGHKRYAREGSAVQLLRWPEVMGTMKTTSKECDQCDWDIRTGKGVFIKIGIWIGSTNTMAVSLDDFQLEPLDVEITHEPTMVVDILKEFTDVMPLELLKALSPHKGVDHHIKLEPRVKPPCLLNCL
ncbi:hypothetical protein MUK42_08458 [Musa troglodytarum]|uniref:Uncharacterized protein n=1 Tax=Musa troglodytarum TaxID=320322 RepID=A0A9E7JCG2_9LILI|nr:hypothetical protein MUK42_08458 [Musa troglodytarum]